ncbi:hypothetical protein [Nocardia higoensis]|uniref:hypothetical protein n=1 Tax=Nocardia higoensis TaxID=228599 RepID=UPI00030B667C|nr:hypothetical protein [Nocardia higoensis]
MNRRSSTRPVPALVAAAVTLVLVTTGCGSGDESGHAPEHSGTGAATTTRNVPTEIPEPQTATVFTPDPTIVDAHPIPFTSWSRLAPDRIAVNIQTGTPECFGVDVSTTETDSTVTVEVRSGRRADAVDKMCVMIAVFGSVEIPLDAPLGDRQVLSAA